MEKRKLLTEKQIQKRDRDYEIKMFYQNLPPGARSYRKIAKFFGVSKSTVHFAIKGRKKNK